MVQVTLSDGSVAHIYTGDRWQQAADGIKGHDPQVWLPLTFDNATGEVQQVKWVDSFTLDLRVHH